MKTPGSAADLPVSKVKSSDVVPIVIDGIIYEKTQKEALDIALTILAVISGRLNG